MASASKILLILGSGGRVGASVASLFGHKGYSVAIAARSLEDNKVNAAGQLELRADFANADTLAPTFEKVKEKFGAPPNVVVYNGKPTVRLMIWLLCPDKTTDTPCSGRSTLCTGNRSSCSFARRPQSGYGD